MKTKQAYATLPHVSGFIDWLAAELDSKTLFNHQYVERRSRKEWSCDSLFGAYESYSWSFPGNARLAYNSGSCSTSNAKALEALRQDLLAAGTDDALVLQAATDVMAWGGSNSPQRGMAQGKQGGPWPHDSGSENRPDPKRP
ncbi:hypothetical protein [Pseudomonas rhodesiae]|uniref:hypothetical protein n=1 Tax=Pseudomonas rhodesiae TaxID=76760 RepID=UPI00201B8CE6|nr:hypothetical protein [Pseudomonas rhodesiae]